MHQLILVSFFVCYTVLFGFQLITFRLEYTCAKDEYKRGNEVIRGWENLLNKQRDVFRKEESDWKMAYICRKEGKSTGELCWSLDLEGLGIKTLNVELKGITKYEDVGFLLNRIILSAFPEIKL